MARENSYAAAYQCLRQQKEKRALREAQMIQTESDKKKEFVKNYYSIRENGELSRRRHGQLMEMCRDNALKTAIKGIFIGALEEGTLTDNGLLLAESMVEQWIQECGGASKILAENKNKTFLLNRIAQIVEDAAQEEVEEIEDIDKDEDIKSDNEEEENDEKVAKAMETLRDKIGDDEEANKALDIIQGKVEDEEDDDDDEDDDESDDEEKESDESENKVSEDDIDVDDELGIESSDDESSDEEPKEESENEPDEENPEAENNDSEDIGDDATTTADDNESDVAEDITDDLAEVPDEPLSVDGEAESKGKVLDDLEKEEDVQKAVELIRQRVADAEENFIKRNAEDKKQVEELIGRISDNVKTVEDIADKEDPESKIAEESAMMNKRRIKEISNNRPLTVMEKMTRLLMENVTKNTVLREQYISENNQIDTGLVVESAKIMYGFLETLNTLQFEKVDANYISKVLESMK